MPESMTVYERARLGGAWSRPLCGPGCVPRIRPGVAVDLRDGRITLEGPFQSLSLTGPVGAIQAASQALGLNPGPALPLGPQAERLRGLLDPLVVQGMVFDASAPMGTAECSGLNLVGTVLDRIHALGGRLFMGCPVLNGLIDGTEPREVAEGWLLESFFYTSHAERHIGPVLGHPMDPEEREHWAGLYEEERTHFRIYRALFRELGWDLEARRRMDPMAQTRGFIDILRAQALKGPATYAGVVMLMEQPLGAESIEEDPLFWSMCRNYGFNRNSIRPLFEHSRANGTNGHSELGAYVLARRPWLDGDEVEAVLGGVERMLAALEAWYLALGRRYRDPEFNGPRLRGGQALQARGSATGPSLGMG